MNSYGVRSLGVALLLASVVIFGGCSSGPSIVLSGNADEPIPWTAAPGMSFAPPKITAQNQCRKIDLKVAAGQVGAREGRITQEIVFTNVAGFPCYFAEPPLGTAALSNGAVRNIAPARYGIGRLDLVSGQRAHLILGTPAGVCRKISTPIVAHALRLLLPGGDQTDVTGTWVNVECGAPRVMDFFADAQPIPSVPASSLQVALSAPTSVSRGTQLVYIVQLSNPTSAPIMLSPCPSYTEWFGMGPAALKQTLQLNCAHLQSILAGQSVAFEMRIDVPKATPIGSTKLAWNLEVPGYPSAGVTLSVT